MQCFFEVAYNFCWGPAGRQASGTTEGLLQLMKTTPKTRTEEIREGKTTGGTEEIDHLSQGVVKHNHHV